MTPSIKGTVYLLMTMIPLFILGYILSVNYEQMFFIFEWLLGVVVLSVFVLSIKSIREAQDERKWIAVSILAFILQFSVLSLFLGPYTFYPMIYIYYCFAVMAFIVFFKALQRNGTLRALPITFLIITGAFTVYVALINSLWGKDWI
ncbi:hypothetical protein N780_04230 [Pontibacillus chungwhensis BH030062]|uniref:Uncharacterized protein n=1 Tax=Pontibacillus chungwhensis BH030062 TaxID=1385513 RepID=A0A0A2UVR1_9BACI|nr:hypothetical protein [Pontibacillus chungwhensis]KGP90601.1 hypothetical protein N780_04230 [Pontibacillus chungwhensis BH030062]